MAARNMKSAIADGLWYRRRWKKNPIVGWTL